MSAATVVVLAVLVGAVLWTWQRISRGRRWSSPSSPRCPPSPSRRALPWPVLIVVGLLLAVVAWHRFSRTSATVTRWGARTRRKSGVASTVRHRPGRVRVAAMRRRPPPSAPPCRGSSRRAGGGSCRAADCEVGVQLCRVGLLRVWISIEDVLIVFGGPRTGKTQCLAGRIIDAPGAVLVTSHPHRPATTCAARCARERGPVYVFNAVGLGGLAVHDHVRPAHRLRRPGDGGRAGHGHARRHLRPRRVGGPGVLGRPGPPRPRRAAARRRARRASRCATSWPGWPTRSRRSPDVPVAAAPLAGAGVRAATSTQFVGTNARTRTSITSTVMPALGWLTHPAAAAAAAARGGRVRRRRAARSRGRRCSCSAGRRPRPRRWCAR